MDSRYTKSTLVFILAGGQGERLYPLTKDRSKPAVPFGGIYRIIDFPLSNSLNSDLKKIIVLTQYKSLSLDRHLKHAWNIFSRELEGFIDAVPPQQRIDSNWYRGTADAIFQNIYIIEMEKPELVMILSGDHVYKMDYRKMINFHLQNNGDVTIGAVSMPIAKADRFGVLEVDENNRVIGFSEKPEKPQPIPGNENNAYVSMGIYVFKTEMLVRYLSEDHKSEGSYDFGKDIIPRIFSSDSLFAYDYFQHEIDYPYWRDIGTIKSYFDANMDLVSVSPLLNLYDREWPIRTYMEQWPPAKTVFDDDRRKGLSINSILSNGAIISGAEISRSVISPGVKVNSFSEIQDSIIMHGVNVERNVKIKKAIIDKGVNIPEGEVIGFDLENDKKRFEVTPEGITVLPKNFLF